MTKGRLEAFSDGVLAIILTIMVLELKKPEGHDLEALLSLLPTLLSYVLSFIYVGIYWNNHHHLLHAADRVNGVVLWANLHMLFWLSLVPFITHWIADDPSASLPTAFYGVVLFMAGIAFTFLNMALIRVNGRDGRLARATRAKLKGQLSQVFYVVAIALAFVKTWMADVLYGVVALMWFVPDPRIEKAID